MNQVLLHSSSLDQLLGRFVLQEDKTKTAYATGSTGETQKEVLLGKNFIKGDLESFATNCLKGGVTR